MLGKQMSVNIVNTILFLVKKRLNWDYKYKKETKIQV